MIIKLQYSNSSDNYVILENISNISYSTKPKEVRESAGVEAVYYTSDGAEFLNSITCEHEGKWMDFYFDGEAYICTNEGKTVQKIPAITASIRPL